MCVCMRCWIGTGVRFPCQTHLNKNVPQLSSGVQSRTQRIRSSIAGSSIAIRTCISCSISRRISETVVEIVLLNWGFILNIVFLIRRICWNGLVINVQLCSLHQRAFYVIFSCISHASGIWNHCNWTIQSTRIARVHHLGLRRRSVSFFSSLFFTCFSFSVFPHFPSPSPHCYILHRTFFYLCYSHALFSCF
ncbi:hypothetical protein BJ741DRAFT_626916 [Chytriomyces cf. hyalinus JEL632]|nr:hypothetical protein BJ741DRAFT_626916 [Chytriomyces cf. hyalinus JEL632]